MKFQLADFDAIAFDFEGTLASTIPIHHRTRIEAFRRHGFGHITKEEHERGSTYGSSHFDILGGILHAAGEIDKSIAFYKNPVVLKVIATKSMLFSAAAEKGFDTMPGAVDFITTVAPHLVGRMAIVTSSEEEFVHPFLQRHALKKYFPDELVIGHESVMDEGLHAKPSGDPYLLAADRLSAKRVLVFEDTVPGVIAAKRANTTVVALTFDRQNTLLFRNHQLDYPPDVIVDSYDEATAMLGLK